jgi:hypothetical protein
MCTGTSGEISRELPTALPQLPVFLADREIQVGSLPLLHLAAAHTSL